MNVEQRQPQLQLASQARRLRAERQRGRDTCEQPVSTTKRASLTTFLRADLPQDKERSVRTLTKVH